MTLAEFKAWLDGYLDGKDGLTAEQVATVQAKLTGVTPDRLSLPEPQHKFELPAFPYGPATSYGAALHVPHDPNIRVTNGSAAYVNGEYAGPSD